MSIVYNLFNKSNLKTLAAKISKIKTIAKDIEKLSDNQLKEEYALLKSRIKNYEHLYERIGYVFAVIGEAIRRTIGIMPYDEQYLGAAALCFGYFSEMKTGEGKTIVGAIAAAACSILGKVHMATVNDYLSERDYKKSEPAFNFLGITSGFNKREGIDKRELYSKDVVFSSSTELIFDYLKNELSPYEKRYEFPFNTAILDEVDYILIDNANSMFSISTDYQYYPDEDTFKLAKEICEHLKGEKREKEDFYEDLSDPEDKHFVYYIFNKNIYLTDLGITLIQKILNIDNLINNHLRLYKAIIYTLEAKYFYLRGRDYLVLDNKIQLINQANGRIQQNSHFEDYLHTAIEVKENVSITQKSLLSSSMSYQIFFSKYSHLVGMSGTVHEAREEFENLFGGTTVIIPTHKPNRRIDYPDEIFATKDEKYKYLLRFIDEIKPKNQPALIIAGNEKESEYVYNYLKINGVSTNLLNAQKSDEEAELVKQAGTHGKITISTNMSGRGTDIVLDNEAVSAGGLIVVGLNKSTSKRIDNQARGRAGRQGQIGASIFFLSLEDEIWAMAEEEYLERAYGLIKNYRQNKVKISKFIDKIQSIVQGDLFSIRKNIFQFDSVIENQRNMLKTWKEELKGFSPVEVLIKHASSKEFNKVLFCKKLKKEYDNIKNRHIEQMIFDKYKEIGEESSKTLFVQLIERVIEKEWLIYKKELEYVKTYMGLYMVDENKKVDKYIKICFSQFDILKTNILDNLLGYFITASKEVESKNKELSVNFGYVDDK